MPGCESNTFRADRDIPDLSGKVILVTGGNSGLGMESVRQFAKHNPGHIFLAARSRAKGEDAIREIKETTPETANAPISVLELDLSSFESVKSAARTFQAASPRLDILMNNAGIMCMPEGLTTDGYELQFGTNHMGHALLTELLLPTLKKTAAQTGADVRVVTLSSDLEKSAPSNTYRLDQLKTTMGSTGTQARYGISKLANIHHSAALAARHADVKFVSVHPGVIRTNLTNTMLGEANPIVKGALKIAKRFMAEIEQGTLNQLWAAVSPDAKTGQFYHPVGVAGKGSKLATDAGQREKLWEWTQAELRPHVAV